MLAMSVAMLTALHSWTGPGKAENIALCKCVACLTKKAEVYRRHQEGETLCHSLASHAHFLPASVLAPSQPTAVLVTAVLAPSQPTAVLAPVLAPSQPMAVLAPSQTGYMYLSVQIVQG